MPRRPKRRGRDIDGILLLDKPLGLSSNAALQKVKRLFNANKAGHTGSLDPLATGLLPLCFGNATKVSAYLLDADKTYEADVRLGETTRTGDAEGDILQTRPVPDLNQAQIDQVLAQFTGEIQQIPPMYSALKQQGQRLYALARQNITVEREPRQVTIYECRCLDYQKPQLRLRVRCSKGTYIRTLAEDIGEAIGCGAHLTALRRTAVAPFDHQRMLSLEALQALAEQGSDSLDATLQPADTALQLLPKMMINSAIEQDLRHGKTVDLPSAPDEGIFRLYCTQEAAESFVGLAYRRSDGRVASKRLF